MAEEESLQRVLQQEIGNCGQEGRREAPCDGLLHLLSDKAISQILSACFRVWQGKGFQACPLSWAGGGYPSSKTAPFWSCNSLKACVYIWVCVFGKLLCIQTIRVVGQNFPWGVWRAGPAHCLPEIKRTAFILALPVRPFQAMTLVLMNL